MRRLKEIFISTFLIAVITIYSVLPVYAEELCSEDEKIVKENIDEAENFDTCHNEVESDHIFDEDNTTEIKNYNDDSINELNNDELDNDDSLDYEQYRNGVIYNKGDIVYNDGTYWICNWYTVNIEPLRGAQELCWEEYIPENDNGISAWSPECIYERGQIVNYQGKLWQCQWWSDYAVPGTTGEYGCWKEYQVASNNIDNEIYIDQIGLYYLYLNSDEREHVSDLFVDDLKEEYEAFFSNDLTKKYNTGIWNINNASIETIKEIDNEENIIDATSYDEIKSFLVKADLDVKEDDDYSWNGINYYIFTIGLYNGTAKIISKKMPVAEMEILVENDDNINDINEYYQNVIGETEYEIVSASQLSTVDNTRTVDPDVWLEKGKNWDSIIKRNITIKLTVDSTPNGVNQNDINNAKKMRKDNMPYLTKNFKEYCKIVVNSEYGTAGKSQSCYNAVAMCVKNFAINCYMLKGDMGYDISNTHKDGMSFLPHKKMLENCSKAVDDTWDRVMLTAGYGLFKAYFKSNTKASAYCVKNGGQLNLSEIQTLVTKYNYKRNDILHYYFDNGIYNKYTAKGPIRIVPTTGCQHKYSKSSPKKCIVCGCSKK